MNTNKIDWESLHNKFLLTVDVLIFTIDHEDLKVLLVKRAHEPFKGFWAIPGGFLKLKESLDIAALRVAKEKTGIKEVYLEQLYTFGALDRNTGVRAITVAYFALIPYLKLKKPVSDKISDLQWFYVHKLPKLGFDHEIILNTAFLRLKSKVGYSNIAFNLLSDKFRLSELQRIYEVILGKNLDKRNFRKQILATGLLSSTGQEELREAHRPAMLYRFKSKNVVYFD